MHKNGKDVREDIASAIEQTYEDASKSGNANMEVSDARGSFETLKERLDNIDSTKANKLKLDLETESRKKSDAELQNQIYELDNILQSKVLYSNVQGEVDNITLNDDISNYDLLEVIFVDDWGYESSIKIQVRNSKPAEAWGVLSISRIADSTGIVISSYIKISGKILTFIEGSCGSHNSWNNTIVEEKRLKIKAIYGYKIKKAKLTLGDVNGDGVVDENDLELIQQYLAGEVILSVEQKKAADVNKDGAINSKDTLLIQQYIAGEISGFGSGEQEDENETVINTLIEKTEQLETKVAEQEATITKLTRDNINYNTTCIELMQGQITELTARISQLEGNAT